MHITDPSTLTVGANRYGAIWLLPLLFAISTLYNGPAQNLYYFSLFSLLFALWLGKAITNALTTTFFFSTGWLPLAGLLYAAWLILSPRLAGIPHLSWITGLTLATMPLAFVGWLLLPQKDKDRAWAGIWILLVGISLMLAVWGITQFLVWHERAHGPQIDTNVFSALMNIFLLPLAWDYLNATRLGERPAITARVPLLVIGILSVAQFTTHSRAGLLALTATLPLLLLFSWRRPGFSMRAMKFLLTLIVAYLAVWVVSTEVHGASESRELRSLQLLLEPGASISQDSSLQERLQIWKSTWRIYTDGNPWIGTGLGTFKMLYPRYRSPTDGSGGNYAHNDYLQFLQEGGVVLLLFVITLTMIAPLWLLTRDRLMQGKAGVECAGSNQIPGLLVGVIAISVHAVFNFIHYMLPISLLTGLYLARGWESLKPALELNAIQKTLGTIRPRLLTITVYLLLFIPTSELCLDGLIFKVVTDDRLLKYVPPAHQAKLISAFISLRPDNPYPREALITGLIQSITPDNSEKSSDTFLQAAKDEISALSKIAPGMPSVWFYKGEVRMLEGGTNSLVEACQYFETALEAMPQMMNYRSALVKCLLRRGQEQQAFEVAQGVKRWLLLGNDVDALAALAKDAYPLSARFGYAEDRRYWRIVLSHLGGDASQELTNDQN